MDEIIRYHLPADDGAATFFCRTSEPVGISFRSIRLDDISAVVNSWRGKGCKMNNVKKWVPGKKCINIHVIGEAKANEFNTIW